MGSRRRTTSSRRSTTPRGSRRTAPRSQQSIVTTLLALVIILLIFWLFPELEETTVPTEPPAQPGSAEPANAQLNVALGNPSGAVADASVPSNYLIARDQYVLSYDRDGGIPNWVSWHLGVADIGDTERSAFQPDPALPEGWYRVRPSDYTNSGYDRGHMTPSADRTTSEENNLPLFFMTNIVPQAPDNNQGPWVELEEYCRDLARAGNELYIISGARGSLGTIGEGRVRVPSHVWKVVVVLREGEDDVARITERTPVLAVDMPNQQGIRDDDWRTYLTSVDVIEGRTGYDLLSVVNVGIQGRIEAVVAAP